MDRCIAFRDDCLTFLHALEIRLVLFYRCETVFQVNFKGVTGEVAFDKLGRRANFTLDIIEQRQDNPPQKVYIFI